MGHEDDGSGAVFDGILDGRKGADDALVVGDLFVLVQGDVEVDLNLTTNQYPFFDYCYCGFLVLLARRIRFDCRRKITKK